MKKTYERNILFLVLKDALFSIGVVLWMFFFANATALGDSGNVSLFAVFSPEVRFVSSYIKVVGTARGVLIGIIVVLFIYIIAVIGTSFIKGKARSIVSAVISGLTLLMTIALLIIFAVYSKEMRVYTVSVSIGVGGYICMATSVATIVLSIIDLVTMSKTATVTDGNGYYDDGGYNGGYNGGYDGGYENGNGGYGDEVSTVRNGSMACVGGEYETCVFPLYNGEIITIGRDPASCSIVISEDSQYISSIHCSVRIENGGYELYDQSKNGVMVDGQKIPRNIWHPLPDGTVFTLARSKHSFRLC